VAYRANNFLGKSVSEIISNDYTVELDAVRAYNSAINLAHEVDDEGTVDLLTRILKMEEGHIEWGEIQRSQIEQMGMENFLIHRILIEIIPVGSSSGQISG
jgi:bacterioferritin